jgi:hypothetical protein
MGCRMLLQSSLQGALDCAQSLEDLRCGGCDRIERLDLVTVEVAGSQRLKRFDATSIEVCL